MSAAAVPIIIAVVGAAASVVSAQQQGSAQKKAANRAAEQADRAAQLAAEDAAEQHKRAIATQEAMYGKAGVTMEGSPLLVKQTSLKESQEQLRRIREGGINAADMYRTEGSEAQKAGNIKAVGAGINAADSVYKIGNDYDWFK